ncbi:MAG: 2-oxoglutarate ferredoxin oxidoreductase subunit alpha, partial [Rhodospirillaceae bacterium]
LAGIQAVLIAEQNHGGQLYHYLRAWMHLPGRVQTFHRPGPLPLRPGEIESRILTLMDE